MYIDTNIFSVLFYRGRELRSEYWHQVTLNWWKLERRRFRLYGSILAESELRRGTFRGQRQAINTIVRLPYLPLTAEIRRCADLFIRQRLVPAEKHTDAVHLAVATVHVVDYLLTWNHAHLANVDTQRHLNLMARQFGWRPPLLVSPETIPKASLGQEIRRRDNGLEA